MRIKTRHEIMLIGLTSLALYFVFLRLMLIAITSSMWVCHFCLADVLDPQGKPFRTIAKTLTFLIVAGELFAVGWFARLLLVKTLKGVRRFKHQRSQQVSSAS